MTILMTILAAGLVLLMLYNLALMVVVFWRIAEQGGDWQENGPERRMAWRPKVQRWFPQ